MIEPIVYQLLSNDAQLGTLLSADAIYAMEKPASKNPEHYIIHYPIDERRPLNIDLSRDGREVAYRIQCYSKDQLRSRELADRVDALLNGQKFSINGFEVERIFINSIFPSIEKNGEQAVPLHSVNIGLTIYYH